MFGFSIHWIFAHLIGDFLLQNDWMAINKKKSDLALFVHCVMYCIPFLFCDINIIGLILIFSQHWVQDGTGFVEFYLKKKGSVGMTRAPMAPWSMILIDNIFHILWIAIVSYYFNF